MQHLFSFRRLAAGGVIALVSSLLGVQAANLPAGFFETRIGDNLSGSPTAMAFAPDGRLFVCLQEGRVRVIKDGSLLSTPFVSLVVDSTGERGLLGIAFDPNFASNHYVYLYHTVPGSPAHNRVSRYTANGDTAVAGSAVVILDLNNLSGATNHNGGALHFGPDGKLYIGVGENADGSNSQMLSNLLGKILRLNADGSIPPDNPFFSSASGNNRAIWALGLRNPFTFAFQPGTGRMLINDVGQSTFEEINDGIAGSNYGWPATEGPTTNPAFRSPVFYYRHGSSDTTGCAIVGGAFYNPPVVSFPSSYLGKYFFADLCGGWIRVFDPASGSASGFATGIANPVDLQVGPEGALYYLAQGSGGQVFRVSAGTGALTNLSTRGNVGTGDEVLIGGFVIGGSGAKQMLLRAIGPTLVQFGVIGALLDPTLELRNSSGALLKENDNWSDDATAESIPASLRPPGANESAIVTSLVPGNYTAIVRGVNNTTGVGLIEAYDLDPDGTASLTNISTRGLVQSGANVMIAGLVVRSGTKAVLIRALGPTLTNFQIVNPLLNPTLDLRNAEGARLAFNDDWRTDQQAEILASGHAPENDAEAAIATTLPPGNYTAIVDGSDNTTGIAIVEIYGLP